MVLKVSACKTISEEPQVDESLCVGVEVKAVGEQPGDEVSEILDSVFC